MIIVRKQTKQIYTAIVIQKMNNNKQRKRDEVY